ncbi:uncharacterized protein LACBIDRAFT_335263 [Laccaria bicolor S238N-H82]|uniref:Predicted protein n=1 Tax=Laccaria bicolor (strain S238N-H82 / ATCC MYA-4686) TaxID=486041 RepID=B0E1U9_LACBS|nr:uncharacterized protein LACBIDRAFT_335263 [Laccaria bicolor S238N-H82]EDQ99202.1 predicted protein [Laccaria bicolor S238N-H82]|eukprot:XP_001890169.1 predicted protein [Laccaria bicolor S238N-H82]
MPSSLPSRKAPHAMLGPCRPPAHKRKLQSESLRVGIMAICPLPHFDACAVFPRSTMTRTTRPLASLHLSHASVAPAYSAVRSFSSAKARSALRSSPDALFVVTYMVYVPSDANLCPYHKNSLSLGSAFTQRRFSVGEKHQTHWRVFLSSRVDTDLYGRWGAWLLHIGLLGRMDGERSISLASVLPIRFEYKNALKCQRWQSQDVRLCYLQSKFPHSSSEHGYVPRRVPLWSTAVYMGLDSSFWVLFEFFNRQLIPHNRYCAGLASGLCGSLTLDVSNRHLHA